MNKLQLYIYKSLRGFKSVRNINPEENVQRHIRDVRKALEILDYDPTEKYLFYLISYIDDGAFFTILRTIPSEPLDHLATSIFIPNGLKINREEMADIVKRTTRMVSNPQVTAEELNDLHEVFSKEYPFEADAPATVASEGREYAFCLYGGETGRSLSDFYADHLYQPSYLQYAGVVLVDADLGVSSTAPDLTDEALADTVAILPPEQHPDGFVPHIYHHPFNRPFLAPLGGAVTITWRRGGFEDQIQTVSVERENQQIEAASTSESKKAVSPASFFITSQASKSPVTNATIFVNGVEINEAKTFTCDELKNADVIIRAPGFFPFRTHLDLAATTQALIQLQEHRKIFRFELPVKSSELGAPIHFEIHTKRDLTDSPVEGYALRDDIREGAGKSNYLEYTGGSGTAARRNMIIAAAVALIAGFLLGWLIMGKTGDSTASATEATATDSMKVEANAGRATTAAAAQPAAQAPQQPEAAKTAPAPTSAPAAAPTAAVTPAAIAYLDGNNKWSKAEMDKYPELKGLFDDLNNFRLDRVVSVWKPRLEKSKKFSKVAFHATESQRKKIFKAEGTYCKDSGDHTITMQSYLNRIDPAKK